MAAIVSPRSYPRTRHPAARAASLPALDCEGARPSPCTAPRSPAGRPCVLDITPEPLDGGLGPACRQPLVEEDLDDQLACGRVEEQARGGPGPPTTTSWAPAIRERARAPRPAAAPENRARVGGRQLPAPDGLDLGSRKKFDASALASTVSVPQGETARGLAVVHAHAPRLADVELAPMAREVVTVPGPPAIWWRSFRAITVSPHLVLESFGRPPRRRSQA